MLAYIAVGSNLYSPLKQVNTALSAIKSISYSQVVAISSYYRTSPFGLQKQPDYLNAAIALQTNLSPEVLLDNIQKIELKQGRIRSKFNRWGPRSIDLDIMLLDNKTIQTDRLIVPHYDIKNRGFMLWPLFEIAPHLCFPDGQMLKSILTLLNEKRPPRW